MQISQKRFELETWYQLPINRKWPMADRMMTSSMTSRDPERSKSWPSYCLCWQSLWSSGPSPLEKLLEQQRSQRHSTPRWWNYSMSPWRRINITAAAEAAYLSIRVARRTVVMTLYSTAECFKNVDHSVHQHCRTILSASKLCQYPWMNTTNILTNNIERLCRHLYVSRWCIKSPSADICDVVRFLLLS